MRRIKDVIDSYDTTDLTGEKKVIIVEWFQKYPEKRFDINEIHGQIGEQLEVGERRTQEYLNQLTEEDVLQARGDQRRGYQLADDIVVPARYQVRAVLNHLGALFDSQRWGPAGILTVATVIWTVLTVPFWVLWVSLVVYPIDSYGSISRPDFLTLAVSMTLWLLLFILLSTVSYRLYWWRLSNRR